MKVTITREVVVDDAPDLSWLEDAGRYEGCTPEEAAKYAAEDAARLADYGQGWHMVGIRAVAKLEVPSKLGGYWTIVTIKSPGLWGIESDSEDSYFDETFEQEVHVLKEIISAIRTNEPVYT